MLNTTPIILANFLTVLKANRLQKLVFYCVIERKPPTLASCIPKNNYIVMPNALEVP